METKTFYDKGMDNDYSFIKDLKIAEEYLGLTRKDLSNALQTNTMTLYRWEKGEVSPNALSLERFYSFLYKRGIRLNQIKAELWKEETKDDILIFHGAKEGIKGPLSKERSRPNNDFGQGFYCGESFEQSVSFVASFHFSSAYIFSFKEAGLKRSLFNVDREWMLAIAYFRGHLNKYANSSIIQNIKAKVKEADYLVAPIADNRMFEIIGEFISGEITDEQCRHCLAAIDLGRQFILLSPKALKSAVQLEHCYLCEDEKRYYLSLREKAEKVEADKVKIARAQYRGQGLYIEGCFK